MTVSLLLLAELIERKIVEQAAAAPAERSGGQAAKRPGASAVKRKKK